MQTSQFRGVGGEVCYLALSSGNAGGFGAFDAVDDNRDFPVIVTWQIRRHPEVEIGANCLAPPVNWNFLILVCERLFDC